MGSDTRSGKTGRQLIVAELKAKQRRDERRRKLAFYGIGSAIIVTLLVTVTSLFVVEGQNTAERTAQANRPIDGVQSFTGLTRNHTSAPVSYPQTPPVGGDHTPTFLNCGVYTHPVNTGQAVHSMEHGAVWITYQPDLPQDQVAALTTEAATHPYELLSPARGLSAPIVASAWGKQLKVTTANDPRLAVFLQAHLQGKQTPEPGAPCSGGVPG